MAVVGLDAMLLTVLRARLPFLERALLGVGCSFGPPLHGDGIVATRELGPADPLAPD